MRSRASSLVALPRAVAAALAGNSAEDAAAAPGRAAGFLVVGAVTLLVQAL